MNSVPPNKMAWLKPVTFALLVLAFGLVYLNFRDELTFERLATYEESLRSWQRGNPAPFVVGALLLYVIISGLSIPGGAVVLSLVYGSYFGWLPAVALVSFASTAGATVAMWTSRYLFRDYVQSKFADQLVRLNENLEKEGAFYLFSMRLIFVVPFFMVNLLMGLTKMKWFTYWWVSQIGMLPGTMAYVYAGSTFSLKELAEHGFQGIGWQTPFAFCILGVMPIAIKKLFVHFRGDLASVQTQE